MRLVPALPLLLALFLAPTTRAQNCSVTSTGAIPVNDLGALQYQGFPGGLYPNGLNVRPPAHDAAGLGEAALVVPRNAAGQPDPVGGKIVLLSIGMSNATQEFSSFVQLANADPAKSTFVIPLDAAKGGVAAEDMDDPADPYWDFVLGRVQQAGLAPPQVQAIWLKNVNRSPTDPFPQHAQTLSAQLESIVRIARDLFPNARLGYVTSRIYAGYATTALNPEPYAYESAFAVKWLIERQIQGSASLNFDPSQGPVEAPWLAWSSYNWADGLVPRSDGLVWECSDFNADGTHPATPGRVKVAEATLARFKTDATARPWFLAAPGAACGPQGVSMNYGPGIGSPGGLPQLVSSDPPTVPTVKPLNVRLWNATPGASGFFVAGLAPLPAGQVWLFGGSLLVNPLLVQPLRVDAHGHADLGLGVVPQDPALCGAEVFFQALAEDAGAPQGWDVTRGLRLRLGS